MRFGLVFLLFVVFGGSGFAQDNKQKTTKENKPDFSGLWKVETGNSQTKKKGPREEDLSLSTLFVEHHDPELKIVEKSEYNRRFSESVTYYTDGRGETNPETGGKSVDSKTKWDGKQLVTTVFRKNKDGKKSDTIIARITWELSKDSNTLTTIWKPVDPQGGPQSMERLIYIVMKSKVIYHRVQD